MNLLWKERSGLELWSPGDLYCGHLITTENPEVSVWFISECMDANLALQYGQLPKHVATSWLVDQEQGLRSGQCSDSCDALLEAIFCFSSTEKPSTYLYIYETKPSLFQSMFNIIKIHYLKRLKRASNFPEMRFNLILNFVPSVQRITLRQLPFLCVDATNFIIINLLL